MIRLPLVAAATVFLAACDMLEAAPAPQATLPNISKMSDEEINNLPEETRNQLPADAVFARLVGGAMGPLMKFQTTDALARLSYFDPIPEQQLREAVRKFQRDIGQPQTGELTFGQFEQLQLRSARVTESTISLLSSGGWDELNVFNFQNTYVATEGTWAIEGEQIAFPVNHAKIVCQKSEGTCEVQQVEVQLPSLEVVGRSAFSDNPMVFHPDVATFKIVSWSASEVISQAEGQCRTTLMTINVMNNEVFQVTRNSGGECSFGDTKFPQLERPRISRLLPTGKTVYDFWQERSKITLRYRNSEVAARFEKLLETMRAAEKASAKTTK